jgi:hypothetical protein
MEQYFVEIADKSGNRKMGLLVENTSSSLKISYNGQVSTYEKPNWFIVPDKQHSNKFRAYISSYLKV